MLDWRTLPQPNRDAAFVKGTEIEVAFPEGFLHRFAIYSVRTIKRATDDYGKSVMEYDVIYRIRDAFTVSDADVKIGKRPDVFGHYMTLDAALNAIEPYRI